MANRKRERKGAEVGRRARARTERRQAGPVRASSGGFPFHPLSLAVGGGGLVLVLVAFTLVARGEITVGPLLLVMAYLVLFPVALVMRGRGAGGG